MDTVKRENMGMVTVEKTLSYAIQNAARNLYVLHNEISAPNMQGKDSKGYLTPEQGAESRVTYPLPQPFQNSR